MKAVKKHPFATESELCAAYIGQRYISEKWTAYAETCGWDILLVRKADGFQVGIQAKMNFNIKVLSQCLETYHGWHETGPDVRAVLVPKAPDGAGEICAALGLALIRYYGHPGRHHFQPNLPDQIGSTWAANKWPEWHPAKRLPLPDYIPDVAAGSAAPIQLTPWKIRALRLVATLRLNGVVTKKDIKALGLDARRWTTPGTGYLQARDAGEFVASERLPDFPGQHPVVFDQILSELIGKGLAQ